MRNKWSKRLHTPCIPVSLYNCYRTVKHEKSGIATPSLLLIAFLMPHCLVTVVQRYWDAWGMQPLVPLVFNLPSLHPPSFRRNDFLYLISVYYCGRSLLVNTLRHCRFLRFFYSRVRILIYRLWVPEVVY